MPEIDYPTGYTFKVMGRAEGDFSSHVRAVFARILGFEIDAEAFSEQPSRGGTYLSVSVTLVLTSEQQRRDIYAQLHSDPRIVYYL